MQLSLQEDSHGPRKLRGESRSSWTAVTITRSLQQKTARELIWTSTHSFHGWTCSQCEWNSALPTLLNDPEAKTAYDRLAAAKFRDHKCSDHLSRLGAADDADSFTPRIRKLVHKALNPRMLSNFSCRRSPSNTATSPKCWPKPKPTAKTSSAESAPA